MQNDKSSCAQFMQQEPHKNDTAVDETAAWCITYMTFLMMHFFKFFHDSHDKDNLNS